MFDVLNVRGEGEEQAEQQERALVGAFLVFDVRGGLRKTLNTLNMPQRACSTCST